MQIAVALILAAFPAFAQQPADGPTTHELATIIAERDRQYTQRFEAQQKAIEAALAAQEKATAAAFAAANEAVKTAQQANDKRLDSQNEFRSQLKDQAATLATRSEVDVRFKALNDKFELMQQGLTQMQSRGEGASNLWTVIAGALGLALGLMVAAMAAFRNRHGSAV